MSDKRLCRIEIETLHALQSEIESIDSGAWLTALEQERMSKMGSSQRRAQFIAGHYLARRTAVSHFGGELGQWQWFTEATGRPFLRSGGGTLHVSLSHSGEFVACALAAEPIGIDVEIPQRPRDWLGIAGFVFSEVEQQQLRRLPSEQLAGGFTQFWSLKEARGKFTGNGLQPAQSRAFTCLECAPDHAEAYVWPYAGGHVAVVFTSGLSLEAPAVLTAHTMSHWRFETA